MLLETIIQGVETDFKKQLYLVPEEGQCLVLNEVIKNIDSEEIDNGEVITTSEIQIFMRCEYSKENLQKCNLLVSEIYDKVKDMIRKEQRGIEVISENGLRDGSFTFDNKNNYVTAFVLEVVYKNKDYNRSV